MCDIAKKILNLMEPYVCNIDEEYQVLKQKGAYLEELGDLIYKTNELPLGILNINLSELFLDLLQKNHSNKDEYQANKYILQTEIKEVMSLPQYEEAKKYLDNLYNYIVKNYHESKEDYQRLSKKYQKNVIINKYYHMFLDENVFVKDNDEFLKVVDSFNLELKEINDLLVYVLNENSKMYLLHQRQEEFNENDRDEIIRLLDENRKLLSKEYNELLTVVSEYVDLTQKVDEMINDELINKININNILLAKKVWLLKKIAFNYRNQQCSKCSKIVVEFNEIANLLDTVSEIKDKRQVIRIIKGDNNDER